MPTEASLAHLEEVSRHPSIGRGVLEMEVDVHFYDSKFQNLARFISYHADQLAMDRSWGSRIRQLEENESFSPSRQNQVMEVLEVVQTLHHLAQIEQNQVPDSHGLSREDTQHQARIRELHGQFLSLLHQQESMMGSGYFAATVAAAIGRMPRARKLRLTDASNEPRECESMYLKGDVWTGVYRRMMQPATNLLLSRQDETRAPNYRCLIDLVEAIRKAGVLLHKLNIDLSSLGKKRSFALPPELQQSLQSGMQELRELEFISPRIGADHVGTDVTAFLSVCVATPSMSKLTLAGIIHRIWDLRRVLEIAGSGGWNPIHLLDVGEIMGTMPR